MWNFPSYLRMTIFHKIQVAGKWREKEDNIAKSCNYVGKRAIMLSALDPQFQHVLYHCSRIDIQSVSAGNNLFKMQESGTHMSTQPLHGAMVKISTMDAIVTNTSQILPVFNAPSRWQFKMFTARQKFTGKSLVDRPTQTKFPACTLILCNSERIITMRSYETCQHTSMQNFPFCI